MSNSQNYTVKGCELTLRTAVENATIIQFHKGGVKTLKKKITIFFLIHTLFTKNITHTPIMTLLIRPNKQAEFRNGYSVADRILLLQELVKKWLEVVKTSARHSTISKRHLTSRLCS